MALYFLRDPQTGISAPDREWQALWNSRAVELTEIFVYLAGVDRGGPPPSNLALTQATMVRPVDSMGNLYRKEFGSVVVYFTFNGTDTAIVLLQTVADYCRDSVVIEKMAIGRF